MIGRDSLKQTFRIDVAISEPMQEALTLWSQMYENKAPWLSDSTHSLNLPAAIAGEIARVTTIEMQVEVTGSARADFLQEQVKAIMPKLRAQVEMGCAKGGLVMKPYVTGGKIGVDFVHADQFYPIAFDASGNITAIIFADQRTIGDKYYTRLEYHRMTPQGCVIQNLAFRSESRDTMGQPVPLAAVEAWADLLPEATITGVDRPLFGYFRYPQANNIDPASPLGVSCYARAVDLIQDADTQWSDLLWEFESGRRALYADITAFEKKADGSWILPMKRLYRALNGTSNIGDNPDGLFHEWSPTLREVNILNGLDAILRKIEFACGLAYGTLSNPQTVSKTATELKISNQRSYATITDTQKALESALEGLLYAMDIWATLGNLAPRGTYQTGYQWDDSIVKDTELQFSQDLQLVGSGIMSKVEWRMRNFHEPEEVARKKIAEAQGEQVEAASLFDNGQP